MSTQIETGKSFNRNEPIPGYVTRELIGTGGYGEVWKALAPGGLLKAVKFVYGTVNAKRAAREMRSLNRIKEVHHPFLLSIERIEVVDGNLIIVTELADRSLKQCFENERAAGRIGIHRDRLLSYLRDAADALDYIYEGYSLQHLDIKPENLLLVGNRVKVADFGLIKNLYERSASLIEGLTPVYAPPEVFEGLPNRHSDQYSLAIVYQEMLTGEVPFDGNTAARLAAQHLHSAPVLASLPKSDQPVIARALSKDPDKRFANCRAFINALTDATREQESDRHQPTKRPRHAETPSTPAPPRAAATAASPTSPPTKTTPIERRTMPAPDRAAGSKVGAALPLPPIELETSTPVFRRPTLFLGIGGAAAESLRRLKRRLHDRLPCGIDAVPSLEMLLLDTDVKALNAATQAGGGSALHERETLALPLRRPQNYRNSAKDILGWMSRRWLYNIPFSLQTEGFRPLGRLALVDHFRRLLARLRETLSRISSQENAATSTRNAGVEFSAGEPSVYLVASISGGTGGGMLLDVAYAVRTVLIELGFSDDAVRGILMHSTPSGGRERDKAIANAYSTLQELGHYSRPGHHYPGDRACGLPAFHGNNRTFADCYYVHLGDELTKSQFVAATNQVAEYLYCSALSPAAGFFDKCREAEHRALQESAEPALRTFGLCHLGGSNSKLLSTMSTSLCRDVVNAWRSGAAAAADAPTVRVTEPTAFIAALNRNKQSRFPQIDRDAVRRTKSLELDLEHIHCTVRDLVNQEAAGGTEAYLQHLVDVALGTRGQQQPDLVRIFDILDTVLGIEDPRTNECDGNVAVAFDSLQAVLEVRLESRAARLSTEIVDWILRQIDTPASGLDGAKHAAKWFHECLRDLESTSDHLLSQMRDPVVALREAIRIKDLDRAAPAKSQRQDSRFLLELKTQLQSYATMRLDEIVLRASSRLLRLVEGQVTATTDCLQEFWKDLNHLAERFQVEHSTDEATEFDAAPEVVRAHRRALQTELTEQWSTLLTTLDRKVEEIIARGPGKLRSFLTERGDLWTELAVPLQSAARQVLLQAMQKLSTTRFARNSPQSTDLSDVRRCIEAARPPALGKAAGSRLLLLLPEGIDSAQVAGTLDESYPRPTILPTPAGDVVACFEIEGIGLGDVGDRIVGGRDDYVELAARMHTRIDVDWQSSIDRSKEQ